MTFQRPVILRYFRYRSTLTVRDASNGLDDAACSRDVEEVVAAGLETCSAIVCITHVRTAARSHTHRDQLSNASAAHFVREDEDPCKMTYSRMALIERDLSGDGGDGDGGDGDGEGEHEGERERERERERMSVCGM